MGICKPKSNDRIGSNVQAILDIIDCYKEVRNGFENKPLSDRKTKYVLYKEAKIFGYMIRFKHTKYHIEKIGKNADFFYFCLVKNWTNASKHGII